MAQARGSSVRLLLDYETTYGADPAAVDAFIMPVNSIGIEADQRKNSPATLRGSRNPVMPWDGNRDVRGPLVVPVDYTAFWYWLKAMFGAPTTTGAGAPYTHEFKVPAAQPSMVLEKGFTDIAKYWKYNGCKISRWSMNIGGDEELVANFDMIGSNETPGTAEYDATPTALTLGRLDNFEASIKEGGAAIANIKSISFNIDMDLDPDNYVIGGAGIRGDLPEGVLAITGNLLALFEDHTLVTKAINSTESKIEIDIMSGVYGMKIYFNELQYARGKTPVEGPKGVLLSLDYAAYYDNDAEESAVVVELINADAHA